MHAHAPKVPQLLCVNAFQLEVEDTAVSKAYQVAENTGDEMLVVVNVEDEVT